MNAGSDCAQCVGREPQCQVQPVQASEFAIFDIALEPFSCGVQRDCAVFAANATCDAGPSVLAQIQKQCNGRQSCVVDVAALNLPSGAPAPGCGAAPASPTAREVPGWHLAVRASGCQQGTAFANFCQHLAGFLLARGPQSWMGHGWIASNHPTA